jgi:predicted Na+-dependent transporter
MLSWARVKAFLIAQHMPIGLAVMVLFGFLVPEPGIFLSQTPINTISICGIFFLSGLNLMTSEVRKAASKWQMTMRGCAC